MTNEIVEWATELPLWQRRALRILLQRGEVGEQDLAELVGACLDHGREHESGEDQEDQLLETVRAEEQGDVTLTGIQDVSNVNALSADWPLSIPTSGLVVIYGDNGSGKSGFARILKRACRARAVDRVLPNVFGDDESDPSATITFAVDGEQKSFEWSNDATSPPELNAISVFDGGCAAVYLDKDHEIAYRPQGLHIFDELGEVCHRVKGELLRQREAVEAELPDLSSLEGAGNVGEFIAALTPETDPDEVRALAAFGDEKGSRLAELERAIAELKVSSLAARAAELRRRADRYQRLAGTLGQATEQLDDGSVAEIRELRREAAVTRSAARDLANTTLAEAMLGGVGGASWRRMWEAARQYSAEEAYPGEDFPVTSDEARCVLCQQTLDDAGSERLATFEGFVRSDLETAATSAETQYRSAVEAFESLELNSPEADSVIAEVLEEDEPRGHRLAATRDGLVERHASIKRALEADNWEHLSALPVGPIPELREHVVRLQDRARRLEDVDPGQQLADARAEQEELLATKRLAERLDDVLNTIRILGQIAMFDAAIERTDTRTISRKSHQLTASHVTEPLLRGFIADVRDLSGHGLEVDLETKARAGVTSHRMRLKGSAKTAKTSEVLSEGEQSAVSLAAFLSEVRSAPGSSTIVVDDPVSSLDHRYRRRVAKRLVTEASNRPVVVFTHDLVFLLALNSLADQEGVACESVQVRRFGQQTGVIHERKIWPGSRVKERIAGLNERLQDSGKLAEGNDQERYDEHALVTIGYLREAWERTVEEVYLNGSVMRYQTEIQTQRLRVLHLLEKLDYEEIERGMGWCSSWIAGHDQAAAINEPMPDAAEVKAEIKRLDDFVSSLRKRGVK